MRSHVRELRVPLTLVFGGSALAGLILCVVLVLADVDLGTNLSLVGLLLGLLIPVGIEIRSRSSRRRRVAVIDYRSHHFGHAVARGTKRTLANDKRSWQVDYRSTGSSSSDGSVQWQVREIQAAVIDEVDAIVIIPAADDENLWYALASAVKSRTFVVAVDTKPPNRVFRDIGIEPPRFVSSRYNETGILTAELLERWMEVDTSRRCLLWIGPDGSWAGEERSRNIVYRLTRQGLLDRTTLMPIESWTPEPVRCRDALKLIEQSGAEFAVYCADDENAMALHLLTLTENPELRQRMYIVGCNGTPDDWGGIPVIDQRAVDATIDILAEEQGEQAAVMLIKERAGKLSPAQRSDYITPKVHLRSTSKGRWLDSLFDGSGSDGPAETPVAEEAAIEMAARKQDWHKPVSELNFSYSISTTDEILFPSANASVFPDAPLNDEEPVEDQHPSAPGSS